MKGLLLILSLTLLISCNQAPQMISTSFVEKNLSKLIEVENGRQVVKQQFAMVMRFVMPTPEQTVALKLITDLYWVYLEASYQHLAGGNLELFMQSIALAELQNEKFLDIIIKLGKISSMSSEEII